MITTGCLVLMALVNYVVPLPVSKGENEDIRVMKCIVEVIADALSRPHPLAVSQQCLDILRTDERLVSILRHQNFLKELQDLAVEGANERAKLTEGQAGVTGQVTKLPQDAPEELEANPDRSMLLAGTRPGVKRGAEEEEEEEEEGEEEPESSEREATESQESQEGNEITGRGTESSDEEQNPSNHISDSMNQQHKSAEEEGEEEEEEKKQKKQTSSEEEEKEEEEEEEAMPQNGKVSGGPGETSEAKPSTEEEEEDEQKKRTASDSAEAERKSKGAEGEASEEQEEEEEEEEERGVGAKRWSGLTQQPRLLQAQRRAPVEQEEALEEAEEQEEEERRRSGEYKQLQEAPHHSKEASPEEEAPLGLQSSPEERELRMMAKREPDDRRDEEGSATRKTEDPEIESLAAIESELENVAKKLHELRRG